jgi:hypothetical protein
MTAFLLVLFSLVSMVFSLFLAKATMGRTWALSPLFLFLTSSIVFINIGFTIYYLKFSEETWAINALISVSLGLLLVAIGGFIGMILFKSYKIWPRINNTEIKINLSYKVAVRTAIIVFAIVLLYFYLLGYIPLIEGLKALIFKGFRSGLTNSFRVNRDIYVNPEASYIPMQGFFEATRYYGLPIVGIWFLHFYKQKVNQKTSLLFLLTSMFFITLTGQRWPLMYMLLAIIIYTSWSENNWFKYRKYLFNVGIISVFIGIFLSILLGRTSHDNLSIVQMFIFGLTDLLNRIIFGNVKIPFESYRFFPQQEYFLYGWSWLQNLLSYIPGPLPSYPVTFYKLITGDPKGFTAPPDFYTEAYINFGWLGLIFISFFWGVFLSFLQRFFVLTKKTLISSSISVLICTLISFSSMSGLVFILGGLIISIFIWIVITINKIIFYKCV